MEHPSPLVVSKAATGYPRSFFVVIGASVLMFTSLQALYPILPLYTLEIGSNEAGWALTVTAAAITAVILRVLSGPLTDHLGRKWVMIGGSVAMLIANVIFLATSSYPGFMVGRIFNGIAVGAFSTAYKALIVDLAPEGREGQAVGLGNLAFGLSLIVGPVIGEWACSVSGYQGAFIFVSAAAVLCLLLVFSISMPEVESDSQSMLKGMREVFPTRPMQTGIWGMFATASLYSSIFVFLSLLSHQRGLGGVGFAFSAYAVMSMLGMIVGGRLGDRIGRKLVIVLGLFIGAAGVLTLLRANSALVINIGAALVGLGVANTRVSLDTLVLSEVPMHRRGTAAGLQYAAMDTWIAFLSWILGIVAVKVSYDMIYIIILAILLVWAVFMWVLAPSRSAVPSDPA